MGFRAGPVSPAFILLAAIVLAAPANAASDQPFEAPEAIRAAVEHAVADAVPKLPDTEIEADVQPIDPTIHLPQCPAPDVTVPLVTGSRITAKVTCQTPSWTIYVPIQLHQWRMVVVAATALPPDKPLAETDLTLARIDTATLPGVPVIDPKDAVGKILRSNVPAAAPLLGALLEAPIIIHRDQRVNLTLTDGNITVKTVAIAQQDGHEGDVISLQNPSSKKTVRATITADGEAEMHL